MKEIYKVFNKRFRDEETNFVVSSITSTRLYAIYHDTFCLPVGALIEREIVDELVRQVKEKYGRD